MKIKNTKIDLISPKKQKLNEKFHKIVNQYFEFL